MHVAFVCTPCKSHCGVHPGALQTNKSLPSDKLIKVPSCCCAWLTGDRAGRGWDSFPGCIVYPPFLFRSSRPEVADWVCLPLSDVVPLPTWYFITKSDVCYTDTLLAFLPKQSTEWILTSVTPCVTQTHWSSLRQPIRILSDHFDYTIQIMEFCYKLCSLFLSQELASNVTK